MDDAGDGEGDDEESSAMHQVPFLAVKVAANSLSVVKEERPVLV